jgi:hypothetical protein
MNTQTPTINLETLRKQITLLKKSGGLDLSLEEDLSVAIMNLISLEEHFFFTGVKTQKSEYFDFLRQVREMRKELLAKMIDRHEGETWCISKHLLAAAMRLLEVGTKLEGDGKQKEAKEMFDKSHELLSFFWGLRLKLINLPQLKKEAAADLPADKAGKPWTLKDIVNQLVDCCDE